MYNHVTLFFYGLCNRLHKNTSNQLHNLQGQTEEGYHPNKTMWKKLFDISPCKLDVQMVIGSIFMLIMNRATHVELKRDCHLRVFDFMVPNFTILVRCRFSHQRI